MSKRVLLIWPGLAITVLLAGCAPSLDEMRASTVRVLCKQDSKISTGSGFVVGDGQHIATNWHNVRCTEKNGQIGILLGPQQLAPARVVWKDPERDLAILAVYQPLRRPVAALTTSAHVRDDEAIFVLGFPGAADDAVDTESLMTAKVSRGGISAQVRSEQGLGLYQIDAAINPGHSGGPIFNEAGRIIGLSVMKSLTLVPTISPDAQGKPELGFERVPLAENIAWAIQIDELLPGLRALGLPFAVDDPGPLEPAIRLARREPVAALALTLMLVLTGGGLWAWRRRAARQAGKAPAGPLAGAPRPFRPQLRGLDGPFAGNVLDLPEGALAIGRDPRLCQLVFPAECAEVGRQHARLRFDPKTDQFLLEDCGSRNGTFLDAGERLAPNRSHRLPPGTRFYLGDRRYRFEVGLANR
ncbi:MAG: trypsin-like peptidase domain-containing protein [Candidatus Competibacter sp.]|nr:trypsin-like peptidase domain-containing protein [Candidatus Competibacter sp.]